MKEQIEFRNIIRNIPLVNSQIRMRPTQRVKFWRGHKVANIKFNNKVVGWYGNNLKKIEVQSAQDLIDGVENE